MFVKEPSARILCAALYAMILVVVMSGATYADPSIPLTSPFSPGEQSTYEIRFGLLRAGDLTLEVKTAAPNALSWFANLGESMQRPPAFLWHFVGHAVTKKPVSYLYRVNDTTRGWALPDSLLPLRLEIDVDEKNERGFRHVLYDHHRLQAHYQKERLYHRKRGPKSVKRTDAMVPQALDALSLFFYLRCIELNPGDQLTLPVHENGKNQQAKIAVAAPIMVKTPLGKVEAFPLTLKIFLDEKLRAKKDYRLWISNDERRLPVRFEADLAFGSLKGVLTDYRAGNE